MDSNYVARTIEVKGIVQGVGFRPFVYQLANRYELTGKVANTSSGVSIYIEGDPKNIERFCSELGENSPPLAHVIHVSTHSEQVKGFSHFTIAQSRDHVAKSTLISPDVSICNECLNELFDPENRRYRYPFINCTNCGPRYTIIHDIPYDRPNTTMKRFAMCKECRFEYSDPGNRRFHAQPNACPRCGPHVILLDRRKRKVPGQDPLERAIALLKQGFILAVKGLGGFHLAVDAENDKAVARLRRRKCREEKPFAVMAKDVPSIRKFAQIEPGEEALLLSPQRPIVLLRKKEPNPLSREVSPRKNTFGVLLPYTPLHHLLLDYDFRALVMTSGNISEEPLARENEEALERLSGVADFFLVHNREIHLRCDDSIVSYIDGATRLLRRSRGYVPTPIFLNSKVPQILACGGHLKNTVCLTRQNQAFLSQHIGDLENLPTYQCFESTIELMKRILHIHPSITAHDLHPDYLSTRYAEACQDVQKLGVQHHHAHIVSCMVENRVDGPVIGLSFDGAGYGTDGTIWGGEILVSEFDRFERAAHLSYVPMPGGASAIKEPWRMAISYLYHAFGDALWNLNLPLLKDIDEKKIKIIIEMSSKQINSPDTSSMGRLFDGIAAIAGIRNAVSYEGQAATELEMFAATESKENYDYEWTSGDEHRILLQPIISGVVRDMEKGVALWVISTKFHATLIRLFSGLCELIRKERGLNRVVLSGGVFSQD
jgi:hydrogenase maturation protein HypF